MGSPSFAVPSLRALCEAGYHVVGAVTQPDRPAGRGGRIQQPPVKVAAAALGIPVFQPEKLRDPAAQARLFDFGADLFVVAAYGKILPAAVLAIPARGCLNVHASLLPRWRGPSPINAAILAGDEKTGVSIMELVLKMDAGPVIAKAAVEIGPRETAASLEPRLAELGARRLVETLPDWLAGQLPALPQDEEKVTYCHLLTKADGHLRATMTAPEAERAVRAYDPWPGAFVLYRGERLGIWAAAVDSTMPRGVPGELTVIDHRPAVAFASDWLVLEHVQLAGSRRLSARDFLNGERGNIPPAVTLV
jgi:methionyl-tRNA formyltransferase